MNIFFVSFLIQEGSTFKIQNFYRFLELLFCIMIMVIIIIIILLLTRACRQRVIVIGLCVCVCVYVTANLCNDFSRLLVNSYETAH